MGLFESHGRPEIVNKTVNVEPLVVEIRKLTPQPGDLLLFTLPEDTENGVVEAIGMQIRELLHLDEEGVRSLFLQGIDVQVVRSEPKP